MRYEHLDLSFNNKGPFDPESYGGDDAKANDVRQAFLKTIPRQDILDRIIKPVDPTATLRNSFTQPPGAPLYSQMVAANGMSAFDKVDIAGAKVTAGAGRRDQPEGPDHVLRPPRSPGSRSSS